MSSDGLSRSRPAPMRSRPPQMSLAFMLLMTVIFAVVSAGLFYMARVPAVREELSLLLGSDFDAGDDSAGRAAQIGFIMFTFTSPLLLAGLLATLLRGWQWLERRR